MFPTLAARETYVAETNFASETYVSKFSHHENNVVQFAVLLERAYNNG